MNTKQLVAEIKEELETILAEMEAVKPQPEIPDIVPVPDDWTFVM